TNPQAAFKFEDTVGSTQPFKIEFDFGHGFQPLNFTKIGEGSFQNPQNELNVTIALDEQGVASFKFTSPKEFRYRFVYRSQPKKLENGQQRYFSFFTDELNHIDVGDDEAGDRAIKWAGIDFNYHLFAHYFDKEQALIYKGTADQTFSMHSNKPARTLDYSLVFVKKEYNYLQSLGNNLHNAVDFGMWGFFAAWILKGLQFFHTFIPNYGISIILLTLLIRLITFPLQWKSFVSMKKLQ